MKYILDCNKIRCDLSCWALPLKLKFDRTEGTGYVRSGVLVYFLCFWFYIGVCNTQWVNENPPKLI